MKLIRRKGKIFWISIDIFKETINEISRVAFHYIFRENVHGKRKEVNDLEEINKLCTDNNTENVMAVLDLKMVDLFYFFYVAQIYINQFMEI